MSTPTPVTAVQLSCFVAVAETGSFAQAGHRVGMTTSGVSKTIARLEQSRGVRLLNRSTHAVSLTPEGERLIPLAREAMEKMLEVDAAIGAATGVGGRVRLGAPTAFLNACLAPLLPRLREALPNVMLDLRGHDAMADLADEAIDLVLRTGRLKGIPGHLSQHLFSFPWVTCAAPAYLARKGCPKNPADLAGHDLLGFRNQRTGLVDPWPGWLVSSAVRTGALTPLLTEWAAEPMSMSLVRRDGLVPERVGQVMSFLKANRSSFG